MDSFKCIFLIFSLLGRGARRAYRRECSSCGARAPHGPKGENRRGVQLRVSRLREQHDSSHEEQCHSARAAPHIRL